MNFLPIVMRELQRSSRGRAIYRVRLIVAGVASLAAIPMFLMANRRGGGAFFTNFFIIAFLFCLWEGARNTADCISEERREGTLGFLFLTDLTGYDIVLGKLATASLKSFQGLFAVMPILAMALVLGGVTAGEFWRAALVLTTGLFFALALGMWVSSLTSRVQQSIGGTLLLLAAVSLLPIGCTRLSALFPTVGWLDFAALLSPMHGALHLWDRSYQAQPYLFWSSQAVVHLSSWIMLAWASLATARAWHERESRAARHRTLSPKARRKRDGLRQEMLQQNPMFWLAAHRQRLNPGTGILLFLLLLPPMVLSSGWEWAGFAWVGLIFKVAVAFQASRTFAEARREGMMELVASTPLSTADIIRGQWLALRRGLAIPVGAIMSAFLLRAVAETIKRLTEQANSGVAVLSFLAPVSLLWPLALLSLVLDLVAVGWLGMWMGLQSRNHMTAFGKTVLWGVIVPQMIFCLPNFILDILLIVVSREKVQTHFRKFVLGEAGVPVPFHEYRRMWPGSKAGTPPLLNRVQ